MEKVLTEKQKGFPIWLVGDSYPSAFVSELDVPLDPRHPTRHTIWTPIWDAIQESVYPRRVDGEHLFICNAAEKQDEGDANKDFAHEAVAMRVDLFSKYLEQYKPAMVLCFGAWAYEFVLRAKEPNAKKHPARYWSVEKLADAFDKSCERFQPNKTTIFPLLHQIVALRWKNANKNFVLNESGDDYFKYVGSALGQLLKTHEECFKIWRPVPIT